MAVTNVGGKIIYVETAISPGNGKIELTGHLGDVMKESVITAISWIKSNLNKFNIQKLKEKNFFKSIDIHVHFPAAAAKKDGPSAGITITTSLVFLQIII